MYMYTEPVLTKEDFCKIIAMIQEQQKKISDFNDALNKICDGWPVFDTENKYLEALLMSLRRIFNIDDNDQYNTLDWYLFEAGDEKLQFFENYKLNINTPEILYDILITEKKWKEDNDIEPTRKYFKEHGVPDDTDAKRVIVFNG